MENLSIQRLLQFLFFYQDFNLVFFLIRSLPDSLQSLCTSVMRIPCFQSFLTFSKLHARRFLHFAIQGRRQKNFQREGGGGVTEKKILKKSTIKPPSTWSISCMKIQGGTTPRCRRPCSNMHCRRT